MAVDPQHPGDFGRDLLVEVDERGREAVEFSAASGFSHACPVGKSTSDWNTKRSPTTRISGRLPRISRSLPKNSERYRDNSWTFWARATFSRCRVRRSGPGIVALLGSLEGLFESGELTAQRAICWFSTSTCDSARVEPRFSDPAPCRVPPARPAGRRPRRRGLHRDP